MFIHGEIKFVYKQKPPTFNPILKLKGEYGHMDREWERDFPPLLRCLQQKKRETDTVQIETICTSRVENSFFFFNYEQVQFSSVQSLSRVRLFANPWTAARQASLSITNSWSLPKPMSIESVMPSNHLIFCHPLFLLPSIFPSIRVFSNESTLRIRWPKYWSFSFNISTSNEYPELISFRMNWLDLLAVQGTLKSLLKHHSSKASILQRSAFFNRPPLTSIHDHWKKHSLD